MDKRHIENIKNFIGRKIQRARNQVDNPELMLGTLAEIKRDIRTARQVGLLFDERRV